MSVIRTASTILAGAALAVVAGAAVHVHADTSQATRLASTSVSAPSGTPNNGSTWA